MGRLRCAAGRLNGTVVRVAKGLPWRTAVAAGGLYGLQFIPWEAKHRLLESPLTSQVFYECPYQFSQHVAVFAAVGLVLERLLGPRFWTALGFALLSFGLAAQTLFVPFGYSSLAGPIVALFAIALWEIWRRRGGPLVPTLMFLAGASLAQLALQPSLITDAQLALISHQWNCVPALGFACGGLWAAYHACRDTWREMHLFSRLSWRLY
jgi:hypothetical protein